MRSSHHSEGVVRMTMLDDDFRATYEEQERRDTEPVVFDPWACTRQEDEE